MTIPLLEVSFQGMFEYGQGYVALSRAVDLEGLTLTSFDPRSVKVMMMMIMKMMVMMMMIIVMMMMIIMIIMMMMMIIVMMLIMIIWKD
jgi:hypothetical protein